MVPVYMIHRHHLKMDRYSIKSPLSGTSQKDSCEKSSQWAELQAVYLIVHVAWEWKWSEVQVYTNSWAVANDLSGWSGT